MSLYTTINSISNMIPMIVHAYPYAILVRTNWWYQRGNQKSLNRRIDNTMAKGKTTKGQTKIYFIIWRIHYNAIKHHPCITDRAQQVYRYRKWKIKCMTVYLPVMTVDGDALVLSFTKQCICASLLVRNVKSQYKNMQIYSIFIRIVIGDYKLHYRREIKQDIDPLWRRKGWGSLY